MVQPVKQSWSQLTVLSTKQMAALMLTSMLKLVHLSRYSRTLTFSLYGSPTEIVDSYKYLGAFFSSNVKFIKAREHLITKARKAMHY